MAFDTAEFASEFSIFKYHEQNDNPLHYLDNAATAQIPDCVITAMADHDRHCRSNVKRGIHRLAEEANEAFEQARTTTAHYLGISNAREIVFTGGATAGINLVAHGLEHTLKPGDEILLSVVEHHSNLVPWHMLRNRRGIALRFLPMTSEGTVDLSRCDEYLTEKTRLVTVTHGSNVTGAITDIVRIARAAHDRGIPVLFDGAQVAPAGPLDLPKLGADFYVFSGHKVYGPNGIGILWGREELLNTMLPVFGGGEMIRNVALNETSYAESPHRFEAGTPPITQAVGLAHALNWLQRFDLAGMHDHLTSLTRRIMDGLATIGRDGHAIRILGPPPDEKRLSLVAFSTRSIHPHDICQVMSDLYNVALRGGHHCAQPLHQQYGLDGSTRASLAGYNTDNDIDVFLEGLSHCITMLG